MDKHTRFPEQNDTEENYWCSEVQVLYDYIAYRYKCLSILPKFQHMWDGHLGQIKAAKQ